MSSRTVRGRGLLHALRRFFARRNLRRVARAAAKGRHTKASRNACKNYPLALAGVRLNSMIRELGENRLESALIEAEDVVETLKPVEKRGDWSDERAAEFFSDYLTILGTRETDPATLNEALDGFVALRKVSLAPVPGSFALIERLAEMKFDSVKAVGAYVEYLALTGKVDGYPEGERAKVEEQLKTSCELHHERAEKRNADVLRYCRAPWAAANLMAICFQARRFAEVAKFWNEARVLELEASETHVYMAGIAQRKMRAWSGAKARFKELAASSNWDEAQATALHHEASLRSLDDEAWSAPKKQHWARYEALRHAAASVFASSVAPVAVSGAPPYSVDHLRRTTETDAPMKSEFPPEARVCHRSVLYDVLLDMDRRDDASAWRERLTSPSATLHATRIPHLLFDMGHEALEEYAEHAPREGEAFEEHHLLFKRYLLSQGRFEEFRKWGPSQDAAKRENDTSRPRFHDVLEAEYQVRVANFDDAEKLLGRLSTERVLAEYVWQLRIESALARNEREEVGRLLGDPRSALLSQSHRDAYAAEHEHRWGDKQSGRRRFAKALADAPSPATHLALAWCELEIGQDAVAQQCFQRVLTRQPKNRYAAFGMALFTGVSGTSIESYQDLRGFAKAMHERLTLAGRHTMANNTTELMRT